ncbi:phasin family protein [Microvirga sp. SRT01]|uniref:Phasin family protein n=2 Tax=Sphingomonas longa TaxID=2778730 RepID=A0ABS2DAY9_9SPHN|nr:phasin family protein [Microvirga sp. SRT01]MBM6578094.1 phasin family protein [Sphingomonas sp. BT552]MBR7711135.1 phasin family protein [Microvirga sp. SRT01]
MVPALKRVDGPTSVPPALSATNTVEAPEANPVVAKPAGAPRVPVAAPKSPVSTPAPMPAAAQPVAAKSIAPKSPAKAAMPAAKASAPAPAPKPVTPSVADAVKAVAAPIIEAVAAPAAPASPAPAPVATTPTAAPAATTEAKEPVMATVIDNAQNAAQDTSAKAQAVFTDMTERSKGAVEKGQKLFADATEFGKGNVEALVESSKIAARGIETMSQDAVAYAKSSFEHASEAMKTLSSVKSPAEFMKLQADYARSAFDAMMAHTSKSTEASLKLAGEVAQPISNRIAVAAEKIKVAA